MTRYCAVYGHPIGHSASPAMQNAGLAALGLDWRYLAFDVEPENLAAAIAGAKAMKYIGLNLTIPHKLLAVEMVDVLDEAAFKFRAVNTIRFEGKDTHGQWVSLAQLPPNYHGAVRSHGFNTDGDAIIQSLREEFQLSLKGIAVLLLGAGGAAQSTALRLASEGIGELFILNRTVSRAEALADEVNRHYPAVQTMLGHPPGPVDLVINATSLGLRAGDALPLDENWLLTQTPDRVYDMIYRPAATPLLHTARAAGCRVANGIGMLLHQGAKALEIWSGQTAPEDVMRAALLTNVYG